jgi:alpha-L-fucosidase
MTDSPRLTNRAGGDASWFADAKLGIMVSWGLYSIPGWAPLDPRLTESLGAGVTSDGGAFSHMSPLSTTSYAEWYLNSMSLVGTPTWLYHQANFAGADYDAFRTPFDAAADACEPADWVALSKAAGAKYIVPLTKHHDGFLLYPSRVESPFRPGYHTERDLIGEVADAARSARLRFGAYYSGGIDWTAAGLPVPAAEYINDDQEEQTRRFWPEAYARYADEQYREIIDRYEPSILWNDIGYPAAAKPSDLFDYYYSRVPDGVVNDRFSGQPSDFTTPEYHRLSTISPDVWEMNRGVGLSFGFNRLEGEAETLTSHQLIMLLLGVVSRNGNLMLGIGPDAAGRISPLQEASLRGLGDWLQINGEAIYSTRPWHRAHDAIGEGSVHWTRTDATLYAVIDAPAVEIELPEDASRFAVDELRALDANAGVRISVAEDRVRIRMPDGPRRPIAVALPFRS